MYFRGPPNQAKERPNDQDRAIGWNAVIDVLQILMPDICIFAGSDTSRYFALHMNRLHIPYENWKCEEHKIGNTYPKSVTITMEEKKIPFKFIRHPGSYFNWEQWQTFVFSDCKNIQNKLLSVMNA